MTRLSSTAATPPTTAAATMRKRGPYLSTIGPKIGAREAAVIKRKVSAPVRTVRDHPRSSLIGWRNTLNVKLCSPPPMKVPKKAPTTMIQP